MTQQQPRHTPAPPNPGRRRANTLILAIFGGALALIVLIVLVGAIAGRGDDDQAASSSPAPPSATSAAPITKAPAPVSPTARPATVSDPRCAPATDNATALVQAGLTHAGWTLTNAMVISDGGKTFLGATIVDGSGATKERSDVWVIANGTVYASTGGARNNTTFPKASAAPLNISPGDDVVQAVDQCVVNKTIGR
ncbi:DUF2510 domain-containing protein [Nocardia sp. R16R-3T]